MQIKNLCEDDLELFYEHAKKEKWDIEDLHIRSLLKTHPDDFFVFYIDEKLLGFVVALKESDILGFISSLLVVEEFRNLGYGKKILSFTLEHLQERQIALDSVIGQEEFYKKFGFSSYFDVNVYKFITGKLSINNDNFKIVDFDKNFIADNAYLQNLLSDKNTLYKAIQEQENISSFAFSFPYKDGYKLTINTENIHHALALFFALASNYEKDTAIYIHTTQIHPLLEALVEALEMQEVSSMKRMYNKIL